MSAGGIAGAVEATWAAESAGSRAVVGLLTPVAAAYGAAVAVRNALYDAGVLRAARVPARVVSVGNVTVGGSGKTPTVLWLAEALLRRGRRVAVVARGYGKRRAGVVVVGAGGRLLATPEEGGDEAALVALRLPVVVVTGERRADAARVACERHGCDVVVLDDGFQHRGLARDADLVLAPPVRPAPRLLPAGPFREPVGALRRARAVLALGDEAAPTRPAAPPGVATFVGRVRPSAAVTLVAGAFRAEPLAALPRAGVVAVAGVARPERFWSLLDRLGVSVVERLRFADHHAYGGADAARIAAHAAGGRRAVVTTEKDLVKLATLPALRGIPVSAVRIAVDVTDGDRLVDLLLEPAEVALRRE